MVVITIPLCVRFEETVKVIQELCTIFTILRPKLFQNFEKAFKSKYSIII